MKQGDPEDAKLLEQARENLGDYKLKTASDYVVPEHQRVTTKSKRKQLMMMRAQVSIHVLESFDHVHVEWETFKRQNFHKINFTCIVYNYIYICESFFPRLFDA